MALAEWGQILDYVLVGGLGAAGSLLASSIIRRKSNDNGNGKATCQLHSGIEATLKDLEQKLIENSIDRRHMRRHMIWTGKCIWKIGEHLNIQMPPEPED